MAKLPTPARITVVNGVVKTAVSRACAKVVTDLMTSGTSLSRQEQASTTGMVCDWVAISLDMAITDLRGGSLNKVDLGLNMAKFGIDMSKATKNEQVLCAALVAELALNGTRFVVEVVRTAKDVRDYSAIGAFAGPETAAAGAAIALGAHTVQLVDKSFKSVNSALDMYQQCGPLVFNKASKPRTSVYTDTSAEDAAMCVDPGDSLLVSDPGPLASGL